MSLGSELYNSGGKRILLLNPPFRLKILRDYYCCTCSKTGYLWHPIDLLVQSALLRESNTVKVHDAIAENSSFSSSMRICEEFKPDVIFSLIGSISLETDLDFLHRLKNKTGARIIVSGDIVLSRPDSFLKQNEWIESVLPNFTSTMILDMIDKQYNVDEVSSCEREKDSKPLKPSPDRIFRYPLPMYDEFKHLSYNMPFIPTEFATVLTTFGCPYSCSFCNSGIASIGFASRDFENLISEIKHLYASGIRHIFFKDMTFGIDHDRTKRLCEFLIANAPEMTWNAYTRVDLLDEERIDMYAKAGCILLQTGLEAIEEREGHLCWKSADIGHTCEVFRMMHEKGIKAGAHFILGLPGSGIRSTLMTLKHAVKMQPAYASFNLFTPRPGSKLADVDNQTNRFCWRITVWMAYIFFYMRPVRIFGILKSIALERNSRDNKSISHIIKYLLLLPDIRR